MSKVSMYPLFRDTSLRRNSLLLGNDHQPNQRAGGHSAVDHEGRGSHVTECIYQWVLESQIPQNIINLLFTIADKNIKLSVLWGS